MFSVNEKVRVEEKKMRLVIQRVSEAEVKIDGESCGKINKGLMVLVGIEEGDREEDIEWIANKMVNMRIFSDEEGKMNQSVRDINGGILAISQFTLTASTRKGNRPSFTRAELPEKANDLYERFCDRTEELTGRNVERGIFGADMKVSLINDGPVTIIIDSRLKE